MAQQTIAVGTTNNDGTGDTLRSAGTKINANFDEINTALITAGWVASHPFPHVIIGATANDGTGNRPRGVGTVVNANFSEISSILTSLGISIGTLLTIGVGTSPNDGTGDTLRVGLGKINTNFTDVYTALGITAYSTESAITAVNAEGWSVSYTSPPTMLPDSSPKYIVLNRTGYDNTGTATTYNNEPLILTKRVRQAYPSQASLHATRVALSDYVYSTDTIVGGSSPTNSSAETSPKPVAAWAYPDRIVIGNTLSKEWLMVVAGHRNARSGEEIACVEWIISDGTTTLSSVKRSSSEISTNTSDQQSVIGYMPSADVDISSLADNSTITVRCKAYPWIGGSGSVIDSNASPSRSFSNLTFKKDTTRAASPRYAYVAVSGGNDGTGVTSTTAATASATPFATIGAAMAALRTAGSGVADGYIVRLKAGTHTANDPTYTGSTYTSVAAIIVEGDPASLPSAITLNLAANWRCDEVSHIRFRNFTGSRTGSGWAFYATTGGTLTFENMLLSPGAFGFGLIQNTTKGRLIGVTMTGGDSVVLAPSTNQQFTLIRGLVGTALNIDSACVLGSKLTNSVTGMNNAFTDAGTFVGYNKFIGYAGANSIVEFLGNSNTVDGVAIIQNVFEWTSTTSNAMMKPSADSGTINVSHYIDHHNTYAGSGDYGRTNALYDETTGTLRTHKLQSVVGSMPVQFNIKGDVFYGINKSNPDGNANLHVGHFSPLYGVGFRGMLAQYIDAGSGGFAQEYPGLNASIGTGTTYATRNDPIFVTPAHTTWNGTSATGGAGNGNYGLQSGSPAIGRVTTPVIKFDLAGSSRSLTATATGAYKGPSE